MIWDDINVFRPERHMSNDGSRVEISHGDDFKILPFSAGKRKCPGAPLGVTFVLMGLARLFHCFDWSPPDGMRCEDIDIQEMYGKGRVNSKQICRVTEVKLCVRDHETDPNQTNIELEGCFDQIKEAHSENNSPSKREGTFKRVIHQSFLVSSDMAHGVHPNFMDKHEEHSRPELHKDFVVRNDMGCGSTIVPILAELVFAQLIVEFLSFQGTCHKFNPY
nr:cytochrome P450 703A2 [Tanacetum cinerariifolium]